MLFYSKKFYWWDGKKIFPWEHLDDDSNVINDLWKALDFEGDFSKSCILEVVTKDIKGDDVYVGQIVRVFKNDKTYEDRLVEKFGISFLPFCELEEGEDFVVIGDVFTNLQLREKFL